MRWETHTAPEYGSRPQEVINRQIVDHCDLVIGVFWTRIGSPTGVADSGTLEEIERVAGKGHPVMLYFSQVKKDPEQIDLEQLAKLREFKNKTFPKALVESYSSQIEFRDKLTKQIEIQLRTLIAADANDSNALASENGDKIEIEFFDSDSGDYLGKEITIEVDYFDVQDIDDIPDYSSSSLTSSDEDKVSRIALKKSNREFYKESVEYLIKKSMFKSVGFALKNNGVIGARDIFIDMKLNTESDEVKLTSNDKFELKVPKKERGGGISFSIDDFGALASEQLHVEGEQNDWNVSFELRALQPKRNVKSRQKLIIGSINSCKLDITAKVYADILPEPLIQNLAINLNVNNVPVSYYELLEQSGIEIENIEKVINE
ncbi:hypothetical protein ACMAZF_09545 [Psychrobium sp. nBUS_13]|uniref:hypothetical protein n=1 Tax=Psychrobium sp. nBUS_13 TaxID=3395319 RepID=UPI003EB781A8